MMSTLERHGSLDNIADGSRSKVNRSSSKQLNIIDNEFPNEHPNISNSRVSKVRKAHLGKIQENSLISGIYDSERTSLENEPQI